MYYPYLRGKQFEFIMLRENARLIAEAGIHPVIEPVRAKMNGVRRALDALAECGAECTVIINPLVGELVDRTEFILNELFVDRPATWGRVDAGYIVHPRSAVSDVVRQVRTGHQYGFSLIHRGYPDGSEVAASFGSIPSIRRHIFLDELVGTPYMQHFYDSGVPRVLVKDGFKPQEKNADFPPSDHFSSLHLTYSDAHMDGFGDYLTIGERFSESGGPAYAVAIHLTYLDAESDMRTFHFLSTRRDSPTDPGGKFLEAAERLTSEAERAGTPLMRTSACNEFVDLYRSGSFPGLGYVKKLSMQHHIELMAAVLNGESQ